MAKQQINPKTLETWRLQSYNISKQEIADAINMSLPPIIDAISYGLATPRTIEKLTEYFAGLGKGKKSGSISK